MPLEVYTGLPLKSNQAIVLHGGYKTPKTFSQFNKFLPSEEERKNLIDTSITNSQRYGDLLTEWTDELFSNFYKLRKLCVTSDSTIELCGVKVSSCKNTTWSSYALDPKSAIGAINQTTGMFDIW